ncbi:MAG: flippase-like domain-containing protein [Phycisphaeraceae bacterium]|nr:flippase-like domain-containing protein [Phycisphaeraceae bacterium]
MMWRAHPANRKARQTSMKKHLFILLRLLVAVIGIGYIIYLLDWSDHAGPDGAMVKGVGSMLRDARYDLLAAAVGMVALIYPILVIRWWLLLRARGIHVPLIRAFRLVMVGNFFNFCLPGTTGGDVIKAYYAAKGSDRTTDTVMSVIVDRILGLLGLVVIAGVASLFVLKEPAGRLVATLTWGMMGSGVLCCCAYFSRRFRRWLHLGPWLLKLPGGHMLAHIDAAAVAYRHHVSSLAVSLALACALHLLLAVSTSLTGYALGMHRPLGLLLTVVPILFLGAAMPISYQGLGIMEAIAIPLLVASPMCDVNHIVGMLLLIRLYQIAFSLTGAVFLLQGDIHLHPEREDE